MSDATPTATEKLRTVLDYVPCEACLATPSDQQELLCSLCRRLDREVAIKLVTRTSVILDRPSPEPAPEPVLIPPAPTVETPPPAPPAEPDGPLPVEVLLRRRGISFERRTGAAIEVVVEPYDDPAMANGAAVIAAPAAAVEATPLEAAAPAAPEEAPAPKPKRGLFRRKAKEEPAPAEAPAEDETTWDDVASFTPGETGADDADAFDDLVTYDAPEPERRREPEPEPAAEAAAEPAPPEDDFVFRPPTHDDETHPTESEPAPPAEEDWLPEEEIPLEAPDQGRNPWARPAEEDTSPETAAEAEVAEDLDTIEELEMIEDLEIIEETQPVEDDLTPTEAEEEVLDMEVVTDDEPEILEAEILDETPAHPEATRAPQEPTIDDSDLWRLEGFHQNARTTLSQQGIQSLAHLSGHDANELATRTGLDESQLQPWIHTADLTHEAGIPIDSAQTLVRAGIRGPRSLAETDTDDLHQRLQQIGSDITTRELQRWKRRV